MKNITKKSTTKFTFIVSLFLIAILLSSSQRSTIPPSIEFIIELKKENGCTGNKSDHLTHCYYFGNIEFGEYEPLSYQNAFTSYRELFDLGKHDEVRFERNIYESETRYRKEKFGKYYRQYYKGYPVITKHFACTLEIDSSNNRIVRSKAFIIKDLDVDTIIKISEKEAFKIAKNSIHLDNNAQFSWDFYNSLEKDAIKSKLLIFENTLVYKFNITVIDTWLKTYNVYVNTQKKEVVFLEEPKGSHIHKGDFLSNQK